MRILVTGSKGQMGSDFQAIAGEHPQFSFLFTDIEELDICDPVAVREYIREHRPGVIINCAAYTAVDKAETEPEKAFRINGDAVANLAREASELNALMIHISTDYVFDGHQYRPYQESDPVSPVSAYAKSKLGGENAMHQFSKRGVILRTSWLYSSFGHNFVKTIRKYGRERDELRVVFDQVGTPTWSRDLCRTILNIIPQLENHSGLEIYHYSNEGVASWYDFALAILENSGIECRVKPIETHEYQLPAVRPFYSVFNKARIRQKFNIEIPHWKDSLKQCLCLMD